MGRADGAAVGVLFLSPRWSRLPAVKQQHGSLWHPTTPPAQQTSGRLYAGGLALRGTPIGRPDIRY